MELIEEFGADSVRLYMLNSAILRGEDLKFSNQGVKDTTRAVILPLWNAFSFLTTYAEADGWKPTSSNTAAPDVSNELDRWVLSKLQSLISQVHKQMEEYRLYLVVPAVLDFIGDLTNWYIRLSRRRFWGGSNQLSEDSKNAYETLYYVLRSFSKILAPFAPFVADKIYKGLSDGLTGEPESVHLCDIPQAENELVDLELEERMALIRRVVEQGRSLRSKHQIKTRQVLPSMLVISRNQSHSEFIKNSQEMRSGSLKQT